MPQVVSRTKSIRTGQDQIASSSHPSQVLQPVSSVKSRMTAKVSPEVQSSAPAHSPPVLSTEVLPALGFSEAERRATEIEAVIKQTPSRPISRGSGHFTIEVSPAAPTEV